MAKVEIYTKAWCGYCARAKALLNEKGVAFEEYDVTMGGPTRQEMLDRANGGTTVPPTFIDRRHVGGSDDHASHDRQGKLNALLGEYPGIPPAISKCPPGSTPPPLPPPSPRRPPPPRVRARTP